MSKVYAIHKAEKRDGTVVADHLILPTWDQCRTAIAGSKAAFKSFENEVLALAWFKMLDDEAAKELPPVHLYTDGSWNQASKRYAWSFVVVLDGLSAEIVAQSFGIGRSDEARKLQSFAGEMAAIMRALTWAMNNKARQVAIFSDSDPAIKIAIGADQPRNLVTQAYKEFVDKVPLEVTWRYVQAHNGDTYNELADGLASGAFSQCDRRGVARVDA